MMDPDKELESFEDTYPKHPFSELVRLSLTVTRWFCRRRTRSGDKRNEPIRAAPELDTRNRRLHT